MIVLLSSSRSVIPRLLVHAKGAILCSHAVGQCPRLAIASDFEPYSALDRLRPIEIDPILGRALLERNIGHVIGRVSDILCMSNLVHASKLKEHEDNDDYQ